MTKICAYEGCNKEIDDWQTYCIDHYVEKASKQGAPQEESAPVQRPVPKPEPKTQQRPVPKPEPNQEQRPQPRPRPPEPQKIEVPEFEMPELDERQRLIVKQVAFKGAIDLIGQTDFLERSWDTLIDEIRTLTVQFYQIICERNEESEI